MLLPPYFLYTYTYTHSEFIILVNNNFTYGDPPILKTKDSMKKYQKLKYFARGKSQPYF